MLCIIIVRGVLKHDERVILLRCDHDLVLLASDSNKLHIVLGVEGLDGRLGLGGELGDQTAILDGVILRHSRADGDAARVHNYDTLHTLVGVDAVNGFFNFLGLLMVYETRERLPFWKAIFQNYYFI